MLANKPPSRGRGTTQWWKEFLVSLTNKLHFQIPIYRTIPNAVAAVWLRLPPERERYPAAGLTRKFLFIELSLRDRRATPTIEASTKKQSRSEKIDSVFYYFTENYRVIPYCHRQNYLSYIQEATPDIPATPCLQGIAPRSISR